MDSSVKLRGHHISRLGAYYNAIYLFNNSRPTLPKGYRAYHGLSKRGKRPFVFDLDWILASDPSIAIEIVHGLDSQCLGNAKYLPCPNKEDSCTNMMDDNDCLNEYGLTVGQTIKSGDLIKILAGYKKKTGYDCPRSKYALLS
jgi:hypothetical protein